MKYNKLGNTKINISCIGLGTMTFGEQNTELESFKIMDYAYDNGINFIDTAEMYPIYPKAQTYGKSEKIIGKWLKKKPRDKILIGTKIASKNKVGIGATKLNWIRGGGINLTFDKANITKAIEDSLRRLQTDYIDIYQLHWPERKVSMFGKLDHLHNPEEVWTPFEEVLIHLESHIKSGKIRFVGVSNETPWGIMKYLNLSNLNNLPRIVSNQHCYNLLNRNYEISTSEISINENCGLLAYSPLAGGKLSGKYINKINLKNSRFTLWPKKISNFTTERTEIAIKKYLNLSLKYNTKPSILAHSFVINKPFLTSSIIGSTSINHLRDAIDSTETKLDNQLIKEIEEIHLSDPNPSI